MLQNVAMIHPAARAIIRQPRDFHSGSERKVNGILPRSKGSSFTVDFDHLKKTSLT